MVDIDKELEELLDDPLLNLSEKEAELFDIPTDMRKAMAAKNKADYVAQRKLCADFEQYRLLFKHVHQEFRRPSTCRQVITMWWTDRCCF